jgi:hypothetical protein
MGQHYGHLCSRVLDNMDRDGFVRKLSRFGHIYDSGQEHRFIDWFREWFRKGSAEKNLYIKVIQDGILLIEVYVNDIIFGSVDDRLRWKFAKDMRNEFEMSLLGELSLFLGLQIHQSNRGIFISQTKYIIEMLKRFRMEDCKPITTHMQTSCNLRKYDDSTSTD